MTREKHEHRDRREEPGGHRGISTWVVCVLPFFSMHPVPGLSLNSKAERAER